MEMFNDFNPIIVLFLTVVSYSSKAVPTRFQSYYSLIFNTETSLLIYLYQHFNPIIVLFLTIKSAYSNSKGIDFNPIIVLFLT